MTEINRKCIESLVASLEGFGDVDKVSLFRVSLKHSSLKKINLEGLTSEERLEKLKMWGQEHRFVLVIEKGDRIFAHIHAKYAQQLQNLDTLSLNERQVKVVTLTEEQATQVSAIGIAFEEYVLDEEAEEVIEKQFEKSHSQTERELSKPNLKVTFPKDQGQMSFSIVQMVKMKFGNLISQCMKRFQEAREELKKQEKEDLKREDLRKEVIQRAVKNNEIEAQELKKNVIAKDLQ